MDEAVERHEDEPDEVVDGELVLVSARTVEPVRAPAPPLRQVAAVAATGFVAGAATAAVIGRRRARRREPVRSVAVTPEQRTVVSRRFVVYVR
jgi:hypothetical protein